MDLKSILGYSVGSPYRGNPYIDINTPGGLIDMSNTNIDLIGIDNKGNKKKMKAGRKNPYRFEGDIVREFPMQTGGFFENAQQINDANEAERAKLRAKRVSPWLANNTVVARNPGDPIPQYYYPNGQLAQPEAPRATTLPSGVNINMIENTQQGYGYFHPQNGNFVVVDPQAIYQRYGQKPTIPTGVAANSVASNTRNIYQKGGFTAKDLYKYLFDDSDESEYEDNQGEDYAENENTAPTDAEIQGAEAFIPEPDDYQIALQMAMQQDELLTTARNPYIKDAASARAVGTNPYTPVEQANISNPSKYAFEYFQKKGVPPHIAAGIVGNLIQESGNFRPDVVTDDITGDNGTSHGIAQWHKDRWPAYLRWASSQGRNPKELDSQLEYVYVEATQRGDLDKVSTAKTSSEAANLFAKYYERPAVIDKNRANNARQLYPD